MAHLIQFVNYTDEYLWLTHKGQPNRSFNKDLLDMSVLKDKCRQIREMIQSGYEVK